MKIVTATYTSEISHVNNIMHDAYIRLGYCHKQKNGTLPYHTRFSDGESTSVFLAKDKGRTVGSISLSSYNCGLPLHSIFNREIEKLAVNAPKLVCAWRLVVLDSCKNKNVSRLLIRKLIETVALNFGEDTLCLITFYDKQERIYKKIFNGDVIAKATINDDGVFKKGEIGLMSINKFNIRRITRHVTY